MSEEKYKKAARIIVKAGFLPFPISDTLLEILKILINENELDLIFAFKRQVSQTMEQLKKSSKMDENEIIKKVESLANKGLIFDQPSSRGIMVYRLLPLLNVGVFEYTFMKKLEYSEKEKKFALLFEKLFDEYKELVQDNYDTIIPFLQTMPPVDRTIPIVEKNVEGKDIQILINEELEVPMEEVILAQNVEEIINKFDDIAVGYCYCRHHKDLLGDSCKINAPRENCFTFGKSARFTTKQGFARMVTKEEALKILREAEENGLVHKAFHPHSDISKAEASICNCCTCCCETFDQFRKGALPIINVTNYLSCVNPDLCIGCGTCIEKCPIGAMSLNDDNIAEVNESNCIGCGVCAHFCPETAISLLEGRRTVYIPPPRLKS